MKNKKDKDNNVKNKKKLLEKNKIIIDFYKKVSKQKNCPVEYVDILNDNFWNLIKYY